MTIKQLFATSMLIRREKQFEERNREDKKNKHKHLKDNKELDKMVNKDEMTFFNDMRQRNIYKKKIFANEKGEIVKIKTSA